MHWHRDTPFVTIGFSPHRPEMLALASPLMASHAAVYLEEPSTPGFDGMLAGAVDVDHYLMGTETEYPEFTRQACFLLQRLHRNGHAVNQVEPYLDALIGIHEHLADGGRPRDFARETLQGRVYAAEHAASGALLHYYQSVGRGDFEQVLDAIRQFVAVDAQRFILRDELRAAALAACMPAAPSAYIEAGDMHLYLLHALRRLLPPTVRLSGRMLSTTAAARIGAPRRLLAPGDRLTLRRIFHRRAFADDDLLAARSIVYSRLVDKVENEDDPDTFPHTRSEMAAVALADSLSMDDCRRLFPVLRGAGSDHCWQAVRDYIHRFKRGEERFLQQDA